jgi:uncharacterized RDD family membrane protein YckC
MSDMPPPPPFQASGPPSSGGTSGPRASFGLRLVAALIDGVLLGIVSTVLRLGLGNAGQGLGILVGLAYYGYFEGGLTGQTLGKRAVGIRVIDFAAGGPIGTGRALLRYVGRILSAIPCLLGYFWMLWDPQKQTWHDKISGSVVVPVASYPVPNAV